MSLLRRLALVLSVRLMEELVELESLSMVRNSSLSMASAETCTVGVPSWLVCSALIRFAGLAFAEQLARSLGVVSSKYLFTTFASAITLLYERL